MKKILFTTLVALSSFNVLASSANWKEHSPICVAPIEAKLGQYNVSAPWVRYIAGDVGTFAYRAPIKIGEWVQVTVEKNAVTVSKMTESEAVTYRYHDDSCVPQVALQKAPANSLPPLGALGDVALQKLIEKEQNGVIYIWSPMMDLSPKGYHVISEAAKKVGVKVFAFSDPNATVHKVQKTAQNFRLPAQATAPMRSFDLVMRGATLHYPATFVFKDGKLSRWGKHGYEDSKQYEEFLKQELK